MNQATETLSVETLTEAGIIPQGETVNDAPAGELQGDTLSEAPVSVETPAPVEAKPKGKRDRKRTKKTLTQDYASVARELTKTWGELIALRVGKLQESGAHVAVEWGLVTKTLQNESFPNALALLIGSQAIETDTLTRILPNHQAKGAGTNYVQAKTVQKIVNMVFTLAAGDVGKLSDYTSQVLYHALVNGDALSIEGARASLSKRISRDHLPNKEHIEKPANYSTGTASSQASQVRDVLRVLGLAKVEKGKRGDTFELNPERVANLRALYALEAGSSEGDEE